MKERWNRWVLRKFFYCVVLILIFDHRSGVIYPTGALGCCGEDAMGKETNSGFIALGWLQIGLAVDNNTLEQQQAEEFQT